MNRSPFILAGVAALMGAAGGALAAAGVHANGGELALRGAEFLILHACAALAIAAFAGLASAPGRALVVVGFGTATTFGAVSRDGEFVGAADSGDHRGLLDR